MSHSAYSVIIIGGGAAGLSTAYHLTKAGHEHIMILEAETRLGGRIHTISKNDGVLELGAQWIHGRGNNPLWKFVQEHEIPINPVTNRDGEGVFLRDSDGKEIPDEIWKETSAKLDMIHDNCNSVNSEGRSAGHYFRDEFVKWLAEEKSDEEPTITEWRWQLFHWWIKWENCDTGCDNLFRQSAASFGEYQDFDHDTNFAHGYSSFVNKMLQLMAEKHVCIKRRQVVKYINWSNPEVEVTCANGGFYWADHVVCTMSLGHLKKWHKTMFMPPLPEKMVSAIEHFAFGTMNRIKLDFETSFWDKENPGYMILRQSEGVPCITTAEEDGEGEKDYSKTWSHHILGFDAVINQPNMLMGWISGNAARYMETLPDKQIGAELCQLLTELTGKPLPHLRSINVTRWYSNPYQLGAYSYRTPESDRLGLTTEDLFQPVEGPNGAKLFFAGEATHPTQYGTVHGAFDSGAREARRLSRILERNPLVYGSEADEGVDFPSSEY